MKILEKKISLNEVASELQNERIKGKKIVLCLGVFDLVHPGHIRHLQEAKKYGDILVVAVTANRYVNKGPDRPVFHQDLRMESIAAIEAVDYVVLNDHAGGVEVLEQIKPDFYVKGIEYKDAEDDLTGKIQDERSVVEAYGGQLVFTDDIVFSSSKLLNSYFSDSSPQFRKFIRNFKKKYSCNQVLSDIESLSTLNVLVIGDAIIDEYVYVEPLGVAGKGTHLVARCQNKESYLGGSLAVAQHASQFASKVTLLTAIGGAEQAQTFDFSLGEKIKTQFVHLDHSSVLKKRRYVQQDGSNISKLFETYSSKDPKLTDDQNQQVIHFLAHHGHEFDLVIVCDFGNGLLNSKLQDHISSLQSFLAINTQINSGNRGYHVVTKYKRADYIALNEPELRLTAHDLDSQLEDLIQSVCIDMNCPKMSVTRGVNGAVVFEGTSQFHTIPALTQKVVDRVGAGDSYLVLSSLAFAKGLSGELAGFLGSAAAAMDVQIVGNKKCIEKIPFLKYITTLLK